MNLIDLYITIEQAAKIVFDLIPSEVLEKYKETMTKEKFISEYKNSGMTHTKFFSEEEVEKMSLFLLSRWKKKKEDLNPFHFLFLVF